MMLTAIRRQVGLKFSATAAFVFVLCLGAAGTTAQERPPDPCERGWRGPPDGHRGPPSQRMDGRGDEQKRRGERNGRRGGRQMHRGGFPLVQITKADRAPLQPGEAEELLEFVRKNDPKLSRLLDRLRERSQKVYDRKFQEFVPRIRAVRRVFERDPDLGRDIIKHVWLTYSIRRHVHEYHGAAPGSDERKAIEDKLRRDIAEAMRIERRILDDHVTMRAAERNQIVADRVSRLADPNTNLSGEPPEIRELVEVLRSVESDEERQRASDELAQKIGELEDVWIKVIRDRVEYLSTAGPEEVDKRVERLLRERPGRHRKPERKGEGGY